MTESFRADGVRVLITGGTSGLGAAMATALLDAGATVAITGRANILLPGGATATGMVPDDYPPEQRAQLLDPQVMGPPIRWLCSPQAAGVHGERIVATEFAAWLSDRKP